MNALISNVIRFTLYFAECGNICCIIYKRISIFYFVEYGNICCNFRLDKCKLEPEVYLIECRNIYYTIRKEVSRLELMNRNIYYTVKCKLVEEESQFCILLNENVCCNFRN